jgi:hypothetical protein
MALRIFGLFVLAGLAMAAFTFGMSFVISVDTTHLHAAMFVAVLAFVVIGMFYSVRYFIRVSRGHHDLLGK